MKNFKLYSGQATSELLILMPLFVILAGGVAYTAYVCFQGIKVQQAANYAARVQGQERISGGSSVSSIMQDNGVGMGVGDTAPDLTQDPSASPNGGMLGANRGQPPPQTSVYGRYYDAVRQMFGPAVQSKLFIPQPVSGLNTDMVEVDRVLNPPKIFNVKFNPIALQATAYGGEDPHMYALPRWGRSATANGSSGQFYTTVIQNPLDQ